MRYERDLQLHLRERYRRLLKSGYSHFPAEIRYFHVFVTESGALAALVERISLAEPEVDPAAWMAEQLSGRRGVNWPQTEAGRAKVVWYLIEKMAADPNLPRNLSYQMCGHRALDDNIREMVEMAIEPFIEYLEQHLGSESEMLYLLEKYKRRVEWFDRAALFTAYSADTAHGEAIYDADLRRFLLEQGVDYPFSQPASASGEADSVANVDSDDPLVCEVKLFDAGSYGKAYLARGLHQAVHYAQDYGKTVAHLVIFNLTDRILQLPSDGDAAEWPPRLQVAGVTVYLVAIRAMTTASASRQGKPRPVVVSRADLVEAE